MKIKIILIIILTMVFTGLAQTDDVAVLKQLNQKVIDYYRSGDLDNAAKFAKQSLELNLKVYGSEHLESAVAYTNLGIVQSDRRKFGESVEMFQKALEIYEKNRPINLTKILELYQFTALSQDFGGKKKEAEVTYLKALNFVETKFGLLSKEAFKPSLNLANSYARNNNFVESDRVYLETYRIAMKNFGKKSKEIEQIDDSRTCLNKNDKKREELFDKEYDLIFGYKHNPKPENVVNGKALKLVKPPYPQEAKEKRLTGTVKIKVTINEQGNVIEAKSACGDGILERESEAAARISKFSPTLKDGVAVKVTGIIVYNFSR